MQELMAKVQERFIPAHAGNTSWISRRIPDSPVHPRACGEHDSGQWPSPEANGSSPRMRGTLFRITKNLACLRFIPAHAGNTASSPTADLCGAVHPRACGEHDRE